MMMMSATRVVMLMLMMLMLVASALGSAHPLGRQLSARTVRRLRHTTAITDDPDFHPKATKPAVVETWTSKRAIVVSGGGTRAATSTLVALKAFEDAGVDIASQFDYLVGLSGGGWGVAAYLLEKCNPPPVEKGKGNSIHAGKDEAGPAGRILEKVRKDVKKTGDWGQMFNHKEQTANVKWGLGGFVTTFGTRSVPPSWHHIRWVNAIEKVYLQKYMRNGDPIRMKDLTCGATHGVKPLFMMDRCKPFNPKKSTGSYKHMDICMAPMHESARGPSKLECLLGMDIDGGRDIGGRYQFPLEPSRMRVVKATETSKVCYLREYTDAEALKEPKDFKDSGKKPDKPRGGFQYYTLKDWLGSTGAAYLEARRATDKAFVNLAPVRIFSCEADKDGKLLPVEDKLIEPPSDNSVKSLFSHTDQFRMCDSGAVCNLPLAFLQFRPGEVEEVWMFDFSVALAGTDSDPWSEIRNCKRMWEEKLYWTVLTTPFPDGVVVLDIYYHGLDKLADPDDDMQYTLDTQYHTKVVVLPFGDKDEHKRWSADFPTQDQTKVSVQVAFYSSTIEGGIGRPMDVQEKQITVLDELVAYYKQRADAFKLEKQHNRYLQNKMPAVKCLSPDYVVGIGESLVTSTPVEKFEPPPLDSDSDTEDDSDSDIVIHEMDLLRIESVNSSDFDDDPPSRPSSPPPLRTGPTGSGLKSHRRFAPTAAGRRPSNIVPSPPKGGRRYVRSATTATKRTLEGGGLQRQRSNKMMMLLEEAAADADADEGIAKQSGSGRKAHVHSDSLRRHRSVSSTLTRSKDTRSVARQLALGMRNGGSRGGAGAASSKMNFGACKVPDAKMTKIVQTVLTRLLAGRVRAPEPAVPPPQTSKDLPDVSLSDEDISAYLPQRKGVKRGRGGAGPAKRRPPALKRSMSEVSLLKAGLVKDFAAFRLELIKLKGGRGPEHVALLGRMRASLKRNHAAFLRMVVRELSQIPKSPRRHRGKRKKRTPTATPPKTAKAHSPKAHSPKAHSPKARKRTAATMKTKTKAKSPTRARSPTRAQSPTSRAKSPTSSTASTRPRKRARLK